MGPQQLAADGAKMLGEASAPYRGDLVAGLQHCPQLGRLSAADQARMPSMLASEKLDDQCALAVAPSRQDKAGVMPLHQAS